MERLYYTPREVADILGISDDTVVAMVKSGEIPGFRVSARITRIPIAAFDLWRGGYRPKARPVTIKPARRRVVVGEGEHLPASARRAVAG
jgi:excisionase family DNA binding protein